jgi:hypothetical protein
MSTFRQKLAFGKTGESLIANWLKWKGYSILPVYEKEVNAGKGPQVFTLGGGLIAPDLLAFSDDPAKVWWVEAKHKSAFSWHRKTQRWVTGIDLRHYENYLELQERSPWPIWLLFLHRAGRAKDTPEGMTCPTGLYGGNLGRLCKMENHRHGNWGRGGMVYWAESVLAKIAELGEVLACSEAAPGGVIAQRPQLTGAYT